ncbi:disease resistance protein-like [Dorcoceras hygrometricum]|uniref:Disease resistance protein-like n=1 Tax=Dorcoceras hygrometricum TaxID=472368 RepID=A0A2Z7D1W5_9LAMI|nr:disease resistance protein-like [Dorcoceras hygrometricum]
MSLLSVRMLAGFTTEESEADTVADQWLKRVNRIFGGLNEGIWPKMEELTALHLLEEMSKKKMNSRSLESVAQELVSAMMTSAYLLEKARSIARIWKDDVLAVTSAEEISNLSNGYIRTEAIYLRRTPLKRVGETVSCCKITLIAQYTSIGKMNRKTKQSTAIREELSLSHTVAAGVHLWSLGVHTSAACVGGCLQMCCNHQSLLVEPSEVEEGEM